MANRLKFGIIADDLTGALDTGVQFVNKGFATSVPLRLSQSFQNTQVLAINSNTRNLPGGIAYRKVRRISKILKGRTLYKKIDSTLRGNVGQEILALLDEFGFSKAILVPALPIQGRTVENGILKFNGIPLHRTSYAKEISHPLKNSFIPDLLKEWIGQSISHISSARLRKGPFHLAKNILQAKEKIVLIDAKDSKDLRCIARAWMDLKDEVLACGTAALAKEIDLGTSRNFKKEVNIKNKRYPFLIVSGSRNQKTLGQFNRVRNHLPFVEPDIKWFTHPKYCRQEIYRIADSLFQLLKDHKMVVLSTSFQELIPGQEEFISTNLGKVVAQVLHLQKLSGLILTGGDVALKVCHLLKFSAIRIEGEILPGVPLNSIMDGPFKGLKIITKGGWIGNRETLVQLIQFLRI